MRSGQVFPRYRGILTPSCGMVRDDTVYFVTLHLLDKLKFIAAWRNVYKILWIFYICMV